MAKRFSVLLLAGVLTVAVSSACGSSKDNSFDEGADASTSSGSNSNGPSTGSSGSLGSSGGPSNGTDGGDLGTCAAQTESAKQLPLDILVMLDSSGSMMATTGADGKGPTKWASVKTALNAFLTDPSSAGIGVGLQIFPIVHPGAPATCTSNAQCNVGGVSLGRCFLKACSPANSNDPVVSCDSDADCGGRKCRTTGACMLGPLSTGSSCLVGDPDYGCLIGSCAANTVGYCEGDSCVASDYANVAVNIGALPGNEAALTSKINSLPDPKPNMMTPTGTAMQSGLAYSKQYATDHPGHAVVMVLATDGLPTVCTPLDIPGIANLASMSASGSPSVKTFVIGVFSDDEKATATTNLNAIATSGGTGSAFMVSTGANVTAQFQQALEKIRGQALPCQYEVPKPEAGTADYDKVNVQYTSDNGTASVLGNKKAAGDCDAAGGWYYDVDPASAAPSKIILCPSTCDTMKNSTGTAKVDILLGCKTIVK
ncbi:VWA domain-containing protein [Labilithrix luteola]|nr:VWA domain-containing protein [Labilithrix luteola]